MDSNYQNKTFHEYDEFISKGVCSLNPTASPLQEVILIYLKELSFYLLKLKVVGANNVKIREDIIEAISGLVTNVDFNSEQYEKIILILAEDLSQTKALYAKLYEEKNLKLEFLKKTFRHSKKFNLSEIIKKGEKYFIQRNISTSSEQRHLFDIMISLIKNICVKILQLKSYDKDYDDSFNAILFMLNAMNLKNTKVENLKKIIETANIEYHKLIKLLYDTQEEIYGEREFVSIPFTPRTGKAILVSGIDMKQLEMILEATKDRGVDVYTHGITMLMAHTLPALKKYPHFIGHFGKGHDNSLVDFAAFPGAIITTRYLFQKAQYLYRGRLFTTDSFAPSGIVKIKDNDFEPVIRAALESRGFTKKQQEIIKQVGFRLNEIQEKIDDIIGKLLTGELKHFYIIGLLNNANGYADYFNEFLELMPKDCYALSIAYDKNKENILHIDSFFDYLFIYKVLQKINETTSLKNLNITMFITKCDQYTLSQVINFINMGIKNIYLCECPSTLINPNLVDTFIRTFGIKYISNPQKDIEETLSKISTK